MAVIEGTSGRSGAVGSTTHDLYRQYGKQIYAYCYHRLRSREEAEDAVQTTFMNAFRALQRGATTQYEQAWLFKIAQNVCIARSSSAARRLRLEAPNDFEVLQEIVPSHEGERPVELIGVEEALERMPENQRRAILLREWQGLSYREIGEELQLSQAAVEMLIFRARRALAGALEEPGEEKKGRVSRRVGSLGSLLGGLKTLLGGGAAIKAAAVAAAAIAVVGESAQHTIVHRVSAPRPAGTAAAEAATAATVARASASSAAANAAAFARSDAAQLLPAPVHALSNRRGQPAAARAARTAGAATAMHVRPDEGAHAPAVTTTSAAAPAAPAPSPPTTAAPPAPAPAPPPGPPVTRTAPNVPVAPPAPTAAPPTAEDHGKERKAPQPTPVIEPPSTPDVTTTTTATTPAVPATPPADPQSDPQPEHGNDGDHAHRGSTDPPAATAPAVTAPPATPAQPVGPQPDHGTDGQHGHGNGKSKGP